MNKELLSLIITCCFYTAISAQKSKWIVSGPMLAHTELRTAQVWMQFQKDVTDATVSYREKNKPSTKLNTIKLSLSGADFNTAIFTLTALEPGKTYQYYVSVKNEKQLLDSGEVTTQQLWQWRTPPPDFSFITGSCAYMNEPQYDRPGKPYGGDSSIFETMAKEKSAFMLWLGDNWYTREADYFSDWGLYYRASRDRSLHVYTNLLKAMPHYAIWDDHDYGPNDADKSYVLKNTARNVFMQYWGNPSYGMNGQGTYTKFTWNDVDFFMLDDRWFRSDDNLEDSINSAPNPAKKMFGDEQIEWLKNSLLLSNENKNIHFRIIATGSQVLNPLSPYDCFRHFPKEYNELMQFISDNQINSILFITGDRHHSEIIKTERPNNYPLYDITVSPFTSHVAKTNGIESTNTFRVGKEIDEQNYAEFRFTGDAKNRSLSVYFKDLKGNTIDTWSVKSSDISR